MRVLLTGGGTGGHVLPNIALIEPLRQLGLDVSYMGGKNSIEERLILRENVEFFPVTIVKYDRANPFKNLKIPYLLWKGIHEAKKILSANNIDVVFSKGGYASLPACYGAKSLHIPVIIHESDSTLGLANKLVSRYARLLISNQIESAKCPIKKLDNPIRSTIFDGNPDIIKNSMRYDKTKKFLLVIGGSSGAKFLNDFVRGNIDILTQRYNVLHITGKGNITISKNGYKAVEYVHNIEDYYAIADYVISRSGAGAIAELTALKKKCLFIPLDNKASRGDQLENAKRICKLGQGLMIEQDNVNILNVLDKLSALDTLHLVDSYDRNTPHLIASTIADIGKIK